MSVSALFKKPNPKHTSWDVQVDVKMLRDRFQSILYPSKLSMFYRSGFSQGGGVQPQKIPKTRPFSRNVTRVIPDTKNADRYPKL